MPHVLQLDYSGWPALSSLPPPPRQQPPMHGHPQQMQFNTLPEPASISHPPPGIPLDIWHGSRSLHTSTPPLFAHAHHPHPAASRGPFIDISRPSTPPSTQSPQPDLDRFAPVYVPLWMRQIAAAEPARVIRHSNPPGQNGQAFAKAIFPKTLYDDIQEEKIRAEKDVMSTINLDLDQLEKLDNAEIEPRYASKLLSLQVKEFHARKLDLAASTLYNVEISPATLDEAGTHGLFRLEAPEIREGYPMLDVNDVVFLRHLRASPQGGSFWEGSVYLAEVRAIKRSRALVLIQCNPLNGIIKDAPERFVVAFEPQGRPYYAAREATLNIQHHLRQETSANADLRLAHSWLFPSSKDYLRPMPPNNNPPPLTSRIEWKDKHLNSEQKTAVTSLVHHRRIIPYLVSGPPGTGKTKTIVEAVLHILQAYPSSSILLCGASNPSTDTLASRLLKNLTPKEMFRLNDESRPFDEVSGQLLPYCRIIGSQFGIPDFATLRQFRVIVTSMLDTSVLTKFMFTNDEMARLEHSILPQWQPDTYNPTHYHFDYFLCDEAAQLTEQDILPALSVMLPATSTRTVHQNRRLPQICLVGDPQQLGPFVASSEARTAELDLSLLQRLFQRRLYKEHPSARQNLKSRLLLPTSIEMESTGQQEVDTSDLSAPLCNLVKNYRSHIGLLMIPSSSFYNDTLQPFAGPAIQNTPLLNWPFLDRKFPLLIWHTEGTEDMVDEGSSWFNDNEISNVVKCVKELLSDSPNFASSAPVKPAEISVISPFREQVWKIRIKLRLLGLGEVNVGRESDMQGAENRVIIISSVRTSLRFVKDDVRRNRGLIFEPKRFNVATTRSKELLVVIGHIPTLQGDPFWRALIQLGMRHGCCKGIDSGQLTVSEDAALGIGALEELYMQGRKQGECESGPVALAGSVARAVLRGGDDD